MAKIKAKKTTRVLAIKKLDELVDGIVMRARARTASLNERPLGKGCRTKEDRRRLYEAGISVGELKVAQAIVHITS